MVDAVKKVQDSRPAPATQAKTEAARDRVATPAPQKPAEPAKKDGVDLSADAAEPRDTDDGMDRVRAAIADRASSDARPATGGSDSAQAVADRPETDSQPEDTKPEDEPKPNLGDTAQVLLDNIDKLDTAGSQNTDPDGVIGRKDLEAIAGDENADAKLREAAKNALSNENWLNALDLGKGGGEVDHKFNRDDLQAVVDEERKHAQKMSIEETASTVRNNFELFDTASGRGGRDNIISKDDLKAVVGNDKLSADVRDAARALLENQNYQHAVDVGEGRGESDGKFSLRDVNAAADRGFKDDPKVAQMAADDPKIQANVLQVAQNFDRLDVAAHGGKPDGVISKSDLEAAYNDPNTSPELKAAVQSLLQNPAALNAVDTGRGAGEVDGKFNRADILGFVTNGLDRASKNAHEEEQNYSAFLAGDGQFINPNDLANSREAQRLKSAKAGQEALAKNFAELYEDPKFQETVAQLSDDDKADYLNKISEDLTGTVAGQDVVDSIVDQVAAVGNGEMDGSRDPLAQFILDSRSVERPAKQVNLAVNRLLGTSLQQGRDARNVGKTLDGFLKGAFGPEALEGPAGKLTGDFKKYTEALSGLPENPTPEQLAELKKVREGLAGDLDAYNKRTGQTGPAGSKGLTNTLNVAALALDGFALTQHDFGKDWKSDLVVSASTARDVSDVALAGAQSLSRGAESFLGRAALAAGADEGAIIAGGATASKVLGRAVPVLGAVASFSSALASYHKDKVGFAADVISGVGFTALAVAPFTGPAAPFVAVGGAILAGVGGAIRLGEAVYHLFSGPTEQEKRAERFGNYSDQILSEAYAGQPERANDLRSLSDDAKMDLAQTAKDMNIPPYQLYEEMRNEWIAAGRPGSFDEFLKEA